MDIRPCIGRCCNPFHLTTHTRSKKGLRKLSRRLCQKWGLSEQCYACVTCRKRLGLDNPPQIDYNDVVDNADVDNYVLKDENNAVEAEDNFGDNIVADEDKTHDIDVKDNIDYLGTILSQASIESPSVRIESKSTSQNSASSATNPYTRSGETMHLLNNGH